MAQNKFTSKAHHIFSQNNKSESSNASYHQNSEVILGNQPRVRSSKLDCIFSFIDNEILILYPFGVNLISSNKYKKYKWTQSFIELQGNIYIYIYIHIIYGAKSFTIVFLVLYVGFLR